MSDLHQFVGHWGYAAIFVVVVLGNVGLPVPEETILALAGYLVWSNRIANQPQAVALVEHVVGHAMGEPGRELLSELEGMPGRDQPT